jgi:acyl-CoA thioester hydrolase
VHGSEESCPFIYRERVRFRDVDLQRIVYYGKYLDYFDNAFYEYLRHLGFDTGDLNQRHDFDTSVVRVEIEYVAPARFDELLEIEVRVTRMGRSSIDASYEVRNQKGVVCRAKLVLVNFDAESARSRPIPLPIRAAIARSSNITDESHLSERS